MTCTVPAIDTEPEVWVDVPVSRTGFLVGSLNLNLGIQNLKNCIKHYSNLDFDTIPLHINNENPTVRFICQVRLSGKEIIDTQVSFGSDISNLIIGYVYCRARII